MKLYYDRKSKNPTYFVQVGIRNGKKVTTKNIERIGKHNDLLKITTDPLEYAKQRVAELNKSVKEATLEYTININFNEKVTNRGNEISESTQSNIGYLYLNELYKKLNMDDFFNEVCKDKKITFNPNEINRAITIARILNPASKHKTHRQIDQFYGDFDFDYQHILRYMDILDENFDKYITHLFTESNNVIKRNNKVCYFDCTNFYFEKEIEDEDIVDPVTGEVFSGLLKYGQSKEHRPNPIVQMGLFMDADGIPLSMCINSGNQNESLCAVPAEKQLIKMFDNKDIIYCSDAGLGYEKIRNFNNKGGRKFIVTQSVKKLKQQSKEAVFNDFDYKCALDDEKLSLNFMQNFDINDPNNRKYYDSYVYKVINADEIVGLNLTETKQLKNGTVKKVKSKATLKQQIIITYSRKMAEYQKTVRNRQIDRAQKLLNNIDPDTYKKGPNDITRFIKAQKADETTYSLDQTRIDEEAKYDGFYAVATNIFDEPVQDIMEIQKRRYKIEDCFRVMKTNLNARPVYHYKSSRIKAHFLICFTALLIYRLLEVKLDRNKTHFTTDQIIEQLQHMNVTDQSGAYYQACYTGSDMLDALEQTFDLKLNRKWYMPKDLNKLKKL